MLRASPLEIRRERGREKERQIRIRILKRDWRGTWTRTWIRFLYNSSNPFLRDKLIIKKEWRKLENGSSLFPLKRERERGFKPIVIMEVKGVFAEGKIRNEGALTGIIGLATK